MYGYGKLAKNFSPGGGTTNVTPVEVLPRHRQYLNGASSISGTYAAHQTREHPPQTPSKRAISPVPSSRWNAEGRASACSWPQGPAVAHSGVRRARSMGCLGLAILAIGDYKGIKAHTSSAGAIDVGAQVNASLRGAPTCGTSSRCSSRVEPTAGAAPGNAAAVRGARRRATMSRVQKACSLPATASTGLPLKQQATHSSAHSSVCRHPSSINGFPIKCAEAGVIPLLLLRRYRPLLALYKWQATRSRE